MQENDAERITATETQKYDIEICRRKFIVSFSFAPSRASRYAVLVRFMFRLETRLRKSKNMIIRKFSELYDYTFLDNSTDWKLMKDYQLMKANKGSGRAIIALTRKVARIVFAMLNNHEPFNPEMMKKSEKGCLIA